MLPSIHRKPLSTSATTSPHKKTNFSQHERHLPEKLSSRNFSSSLKVKGPQHSQDGEWDASSISISQCDAREIGNFDQRHHTGQKISIISQGAKSSGHSVIHLDNRFPQIVPQRQTKNRQQLYVTMESEKKKLETDEKKLDNNHDDPDCTGNKNWYKVLWRELKKQAKRIVNSEADADSSFDEAMSIDTCVTRRRSGSRKKLNKHFLPNENSAFPGSEDVEVKIESSDRVTFHKITPSVQTYMILESDIVYNNPPTPAVSSHVSIPDQRNIQPVEVKRKSLKMSKSTHFENRNSEEKTDSLGDEKQNLHKEKESNIQPVQVKKKFLKMSNSTHPEGRDATRLMPEQKLSKLSDDWINVLLDEVQRNFINMSKSRQPEDSLADFKLLVDITASSDKMGKEQVDWKEDYDSVLLRQERNGADAFSDVLFPSHQMFSVKKQDSLTRFTLPYEIASLHVKKGEKLKEKNVTSAMGYSAYMQILTMRGVVEPNNVTSEMGYFACMQIPTNKGQINVLPDEVKRKFINMSKSIQPEDTLTNFKLLVDITTSSDKTGEEPIELKNASAGDRSEHESAIIGVYRNVIRNETCRMMKSIDMVVSEAEHLFGHERTQIFFDLLGDELFNFGSAGAAPGFIPNMTESTVRQHVMSFFEQSCDVMNQLMTLLLGCPDRKRLQRMPEQNFISLMQYIIGSSLKTKIKGGKRLTSKGSTFVMVDSEEFEKALGNEIPENVLDRLRRGDEMVAHRFDTRLERTRDPQKRENRPILSIFFPSDRKIFIYIPTENGSYWHQADMQRASRICRNDK